MRKEIVSLVTAAAIAALASGSALAAESVAIEMHLISDKGVGAAIGTIKAEDTANGFLGLHLNLTVSIPPGGHGFHIHENPSCAAMERDGKMVAGLAAGGHFDPAGAGKHMGPSGEGHLGDLTILYVPVAEMGTESVQHTLVAPRLKLADIRGRSIMIHAMSDNFRDDPKPLGGGGARIACGVIP